MSFAPFFSELPDSQVPLTPDAAGLRPQRINPWRMFIGSMVPNWLQCRPEVSQGAKLAYARLAQYAGENGHCFPKQVTLAAELGVSERTAHEYVRELVELGLIEKERPGLGLSNRYFFLDHQWMHEGQPEAPKTSDSDRKSAAVPDRNSPSGQKRQKTSSPYNSKENQGETNQWKRIPHGPPVGDSVKNPDSVSLQAEEIYAAYPKKVGKPTAIRAIRRALAEHTFDSLLERTRLFAQTCNFPVEFIPHPTTWFNQQRFNDDPATWRRTGGANIKPAPAIIRPDKFGCGVGNL